MIKTIKMPRLSANMEEGVIVSFNKQPGEKVEKGDVLFEVETDKVVSEVESLENGTLKKIHFKEGDSIKVDETVAEIEIEE